MTDEHTGPEDAVAEPAPAPNGRRNGDAPTLGYVPATPDTPAPTLADPIGEAASAYAQLVERIGELEGARIVLVTAAVKGSGPGLAALNLAVAATRAGKRVVLIDGHADAKGPSQFLRTASGPGLADLVAGRAGLRDASRLLIVERVGRFPMIPAGTWDEEEELAAADLADPIDRMSEHADLVLVVVPGDASAERTTSLGAHADGSLLIVHGGESAGALHTAAQELSAAGAPIVGLVELAPPRRGRSLRRK
jgi:Mrp family chromosome partitioning ATPase